MNKNDEKILELKHRINLEKASLQLVERYIPKTTCVIGFGGAGDLHLRTLSVNELNQLLLIVQSLICVAVPMDLMDTTFSGFTLEDWKSDIVGLRNQKNVSERKSMIAKLESRLQSMLSDEKKTEFEIAEIEKMLDER